MDVPSVQRIKEVRAPIAGYVHGVGRGEAGVEQRNQQSKPVDWCLTTEDARIKLKRLYSNLSD
jgi:hypothetical protein